MYLSRLGDGSGGKRVMSLSAHARRHAGGNDASSDVPGALLPDPSESRPLPQLLVGLLALRSAWSCQKGLDLFSRTPPALGSGAVRVSRGGEGARRRG